MTKTYQQWLTEQADITIKVGGKVKDTHQALIKATKCNVQTGLSVLIVDEEGKGVYLIDEYGFIEYV